MNDVTRDGRPEGRGETSMSVRVWAGVVVAAMGVLFTLDNFGQLDASQVLRFWPLTVIAWGVMRLLGIGCTKRPLAGTMALGAGLYMQGMALHRGWTSSFELGPLLLILLGVFLISGPGFRRGDGRITVGGIFGRRGGRFGPVQVGAHEMAERGIAQAVDEAAASKASGDELNAVAVLGSVTRRVSSASFRGGEVSAVLGGAVIDLRDARIPGGRADLEVLAMMGGIELLVPDGWRIVGDVTSVLGSFDDKTRVAPADAAVTLHVHGTAMLGSVEVKHRA
jgi:hypothetical protein